VNLDVDFPELEAKATIFSALYIVFSTIGPNWPLVSCKIISKGDFRTPSAEIVSCIAMS